MIEKVNEFLRNRISNISTAAEDDIIDLIRTEKLKLLAEVRERVVGEAKPGRADTQIWRENPDDAWDMAIDQFEQNLLKALEEK